MSESVQAPLFVSALPLRLRHDEVVVHLVVAQQSGARGIETVVDDAARRVEPTAGEAGQIEQQVRQVVGHVGPVDRTGDRRREFGTCGPIAVRHPDHEGNLVLVTAAVGRERRIVDASVAVGVIEHLLAVVGEVDDHGPSRVRQRSSISPTTRSL